MGNEKPAKLVGRAGESKGEELKRLSGKNTVIDKHPP